MVDCWKAAVAVGLTLVVGTGAVVGCGSDDGLTSPVIVRVGQATVTQADLDRQLALTGIPARAKERHEQRVGATLGRLVAYRWLAQAAASGYIHVDDAAIRRAAEELRASSARVAAADASRETFEDTHRRLRFRALRVALQRKLAAQLPPVSAAAVRRYYETHRARFIRPERREITAVTTQTPMESNVTKRLIDKGTPLKQVIRAYATDEPSRAGSGVFTITRDDGDAALIPAVFAAKPGGLGGPVLTRYGWTSFEVTRIVPGDRPALPDVANRIERRLREGNRLRLLQRFTSRRRAATVCAPGYRVPLCRNGPPQAIDVDLNPTR